MPGLGGRSSCKRRVLVTLCVLECATGTQLAANPVVKKAHLGRSNRHGDQSAGAQRRDQGDPRSAARRPPLPSISIFGVETVERVATGHARRRRAASPAKARDHSTMPQFVL